MKMKSNVFGYSAKLALAVLAVCGTLFTSCYESEELDNTGGGTVTPPNPVPAAYYVAGSVTDGTTGQPIENASVTIGSESVLLTNGSFYHDVKTSGQKTITVTAEGYLDNKKTVFVAPVGDGQTFVALGDIALFDAKSQATDPVLDPIVPAIPAEEKAAITAALSLPADAEITEGEDGLVATHKAVIESTTDRTNVPVEFQEGFELMTEPAAARAFTDRDQFVANIAKAIGKSYGLRTVTRNMPVYAGGRTMIGASIKISIAVKEFMFIINGKTYTGSAYWVDDITVEPIVDTHDTHGGHGGGNNAGGGDGGSNNN
jgi:hypothetical protein